MEVRFRYNENPEPVEGDFDRRWKEIPEKPTKKKSPKTRRRDRHEVQQLTVQPVKSDLNLGPILISLREELKENTSYLKALCDHHGASLIPRTHTKPHQELVEIVFSFVRIIDISTKNGYFHAEVYVKSKWTETGLQGVTQHDLDRLDYSKRWRPDIVLVNAVGEPDDCKQWYDAQKTPNGAIISKHIRFRAMFKETLELFDFPVDKQALTVIVSCEQPIEEVNLIPDKETPPTVTLDTFSDSLEFTLWKPVFVSELKVEQDTPDKYAKSAKLAYTCYVSRRPTYFFMNGLLLQFLITCLGFVVFVQAPDNFTTRSTLAATLLLTSVAFKFTVSGDLPNVPYITYLGIYHLGCKIFLVLLIIETAVVFNIHQTSGNGPATALTTDQWAATGYALLFAVFNFVYVLILAIKYKRNQQHLREKDEEYSAKIREAAEDKIFIG